MHPVGNRSAGLVQPVVKIDTDLVMLRSLERIHSESWDRFHTAQTVDKSECLGDGKGQKTHINLLDMPTSMYMSFDAADFVDRQHFPMFDRG